MPEAIGEHNEEGLDSPPTQLPLHLWHQWRRYFTEGGARYKACGTRGKELPPSSFDKNTIGA